MTRDLKELIDYYKITFLSLFFFYKNNNKGGYNVGDRTNNPNNGNANNQFQMVCISTLIKYTQFGNSRFSFL